MTSLRSPPTFIPIRPLSQPLITCRATNAHSQHIVKTCASHLRPPEPPWRPAGAHRVPNRACAMQAGPARGATRMPPHHVHLTRPRPLRRSSCLGLYAHFVCVDATGVCSCVCGPRDALRLCLCVRARDCMCVRGEGITLSCAWKRGQKVYPASHNPTPCPRLSRRHARPARPSAWVHLPIRPCVCVCDRETASERASERERESKMCGSNVCLLDVDESDGLWSARVPSLDSHHVWSARLSFL